MTLRKTLTAPLLAWYRWREMVHNVRYNVMLDRSKHHYGRERLHLESLADDEFELYEAYETKIKELS